MPDVVGHSCGNVFADLGLPDAERLLAECDAEIEARIAAAAYCPCCHHCNPPPEPTDPMPRWTQPKLPREAVRLDGFKVKMKKW